MKHRYHKRTSIRKQQWIQKYCRIKRVLHFTFCSHFMCSSCLFQKCITVLQSVSATMHFWWSFKHRCRIIFFCHLIVLSNNSSLDFFLIVKPNSPLCLYFKGCHIVIDANILLVYEQDCRFLNVLIHISTEIPWLPSFIFIIFRRDREAALIGKRCKSAKRIRK